MQSAHSLDLFEPSTPKPLEKSDQPVLAETPGDVYEKHWQAYITTLKATFAMTGMLPRELRLEDEYDIDKRIESSRRSVTWKLITDYRQVLIDDHGLAPEIDIENISQSLGYTDRIDIRNNRIPYSPAAVWQYLEDEYAPEAALAAAHAQTAEYLTKQFMLIKTGFAPAKAPRSVGGMVALEKECSMSEFSSCGPKWSGTTQNNIRVLLSNLAKFTDWADDTVSSHELNNLARAGFGSGVIESRYRYDLTNISLITFKTKLEIRLSKDIAKKLQVYTSKFAADLF